MAPEHYSAALAARDLAAGGLTPHDRARHLKYVHWNDEFLVSTGFWAAFTAPLLMLFETDSALCPQPSLLLDSFARYVFTGAPWRRGSLGMCRASREFRCVGNSGVSLWRRDVMARFVASSWFTSEWGPRQHLDVYMSHKLQNANQSVREAVGYAAKDAVPRDDVAARFAVETHYEGGYTPFAVHQPQWHLPPARLAELIRRCPTAANLRNYSTFDPAEFRRQRSGQRRPT
eukprot:6570613-Prymnesium_polylepis.1